MDNNEGQPIKKEFNFGEFLDRIRDSYAPGHRRDVESHQEKQMRTDLSVLNTTMFLQEGKGRPLSDEEIYQTLDAIDDKYDGKFVERRKEIMREIEMDKYIRDENEEDKEDE